MWHGVVKDVNNMVSIFRYNSTQISACDVCQWMNRKMTTGAPELHPVSVKEPWYMVMIDFVIPLSPQANDGSRYILTLNDYFT